ncbi:uroporphyrinogen-III C-methyltransferase [Paralcaligenes ureilyticus]|uniref:Uroporphyrin-3 C-methyltransferase n=1 Tax=Paralcaligenes ureilyticus TaxID=627131 RepID=A0A4R3LUB2_9BURK|nr:uroporphyrinogen-III C-methyltransferase [Paralcaligenes ureilyticus]TCT04084.1 uroporphyrin-3 C-methyltransferase [Paralcaligenes ureilyticus]
MIDKKPESPEASPLAAGKKESSPGNAAAATGPRGAAKPRKRYALPIAFVIVVLVALALGAGVWYQQKMFKQSQAAVSSQVAASSSVANQASEQAQQAISLAQSQASQLAALQASLHESQSRYQSLEQAFQNLTDSGSDVALVNDVDQLVTIAHQQLSLGGNVANAIVALETAQTQLARANRASLASLQQTINGDLDRLRLVTSIDVPLLTGRLDELSQLIGKAPLWVPDDAAPKVSRVVASQAPEPATAQDNAAGADANWWEQTLATARTWSASAWTSLASDLGKFISVRRAQDPAALLMSPDQASQLRENLRLRIMTAQLALLMHQPDLWKTETQALVKAIDTRYDGQADETRQAHKLAEQLAQTSIDLKLPTVNNSLQALETLRDASARAAQEANTAARPAPDSNTAAKTPATPAQPAAPRE